MRLLPLFLLATACAATGDGPSRGEADLTRELAGRTAGLPQDCVSLSPTGTIVARGRQTLVYRSGDTIWVNRLKAECPGLREYSTLSVEVWGGSRYCRGAQFWTTQPGLSIPGPICRLDRFTPYRR